MSAVRMCDRCGAIFSEREDGWSTFSGTRIQRDEHGQQRNITEQTDSCVQCTTRWNVDTASGDRLDDRR